MNSDARELRSDHLILVADVGGTFVRCGLARNRIVLDEPVRIERDQHESLAHACQHYLSDAARGLHLDGASIAAAGRKHDGRIDMTNAHWGIDPLALADELGLRRSRICLLNDFEALAWSLAALDAGDLAAVPGGASALAGSGSPKGDPSGHRVVLGPGTGLGVAAMLRMGNDWHVLASEGGHAGFAPQTRLEHAIGDLASTRFGRVSWERVISGPGLVLIHEACAQFRGQPPQAITPAGVVKACSHGDPIAVESVRTFIELLGAFAGDLALIYGATGGVMLAGGVLGEIATVMPLDALRARFEAKGRFRPLLETIPLDRIVARFAALRGAAIAYCT